jgi:tellurite resistance protein TehA-like permease
MYLVYKLEQCNGQSLRLSTCDYSTRPANPIGVSIIANVYPLVAPLAPTVFLVLQAVQLLAALFIILLLYIRLILIHSSVPSDSLL